MPGRSLWQRCTQAAKEAERRSFNPLAIAAQVKALATFGSRRSELMKLNQPVLVLHGDEDPLIPIVYGKQLFASFAPGKATFEPIPGMGHFLAPGAWDEIEPKLLTHLQS